MNATAVGASVARTLKRTTIVIVCVAIAAIGLTAEIVPATGVARYSTATYFATKEISQWAFGS